MKKIIFILTLFTLTGFAPVASTDDWHLKKNENGILIYSRNTEESKFKELKSVFQIKTSLSSIVALLTDYDSYVDWVYRCGKSAKLKKISDNESIHYQSVVAPWPVSNRDIVMNVKITQDSLTKTITQKSTCLPNYISSVDEHVRVSVFKALWKIKPLKNGLVEIEYQLLVDPGGNVPAWLVNLAVVDGPFETASNMKTWLMKDKYQKATVPFIKEPQ